METCEVCQIAIEKKYGSGRFCSRKCSCTYTSRLNRSEKNKKISEGLSSSRPARFVEKSCERCGTLCRKPWNRRSQRFCSRQCSSQSTGANPETQQKIREARLQAIENGNVGFGIRCSLDGVRCDSALEYAFIKWYKERHPNARITRYSGRIESHGIVFIPDFLIDDKIVVEVKYRKEAISYRLGSKWSGYIELQEKKREILESLGSGYIWFTDETCGQKFYRQCLNEVKNSH
jgi:hypothetical protein